MVFLCSIGLLSFLVSFELISLMVVSGVLSLCVVVVMILLRLVSFCLWVSVIWVVRSVLFIEWFLLVI